MMHFTSTIVLLVLAYAMGSISTGLLVSHAMNLPDPRTKGSGNIGMTNVMRVGGKLAGLLTLAGDLLKGAIPLLIARLLGADGFILGLVGFVAVLGHCFSAYYSFKGGKGVATTFGVLLILSPVVCLVATVIWVAIIAITRYSSLASLSAVAVGAVLMLFVMPGAFLPMLLIVALIVWKHKSNIERLRAGNENKFVLL